MVEEEDIELYIKLNVKSVPINTIENDNNRQCCTL